MEAGVAFHRILKTFRAASSFVTTVLAKFLPLRDALLRRCFGHQFIVIEDEDFRNDVELELLSMGAPLVMLDLLLNFLPPSSASVIFTPSDGGWACSFQFRLPGPPLAAYVEKPSAARFFPGSSDGGGPLAVDGANSFGRNLAGSNCLQQ